MSREPIHIVAHMCWLAYYGRSVNNRQTVDRLGTVIMWSYASFADLVTCANTKGLNEKGVVDGLGSEVALEILCFPTK